MAKWPLHRVPPVQLQTNITKNEAFPLVKCICQCVQNGPLIILVLVWHKSIHF